MAEIEGKVLPFDREADYEKLKLDLKSKAQADKASVTQLSSDEDELLTYVTNHSNDFLYVIETHIWAGRPIWGAPNLAPWTYGITKQAGTSGVKWGVVYATGTVFQKKKKNATGTDSTHRKWVVAFDSAAEKAYAEAGPIGPVDWNVVKVKLDASEKKSEYTDPILGGRTVAEIEKEDHAQGHFFG